jgi:hypothetical protein
MATRTHTHQQFFKDLLPRNCNNKKLMVCRNVPWVGLFKICLHGSEILNIFPTGSEKNTKTS